MTEEHPTTTDRWFRGFLVVAFVVMAALLLLLARQNRSLKRQLAAATTTGQVETTPRVGTELEPLVLPGLDGLTVNVDFTAPDRETVLLIFSPDCPACGANMERWRAIQQHHAPDRYSLVYVSTVDESTTREYLVDHAWLDSNPVLIADRPTLDALGVTRIPTTVVVEPGGTVRKVWIGVLPDEALEEFL